MNIQAGDVFWLNLEGIKHPYVVINNESPSDSLIVYALTSNAKKAHIPGNVVLEKGEANLEKQSIVEVSKFYEIKKDLLTERVGTLSPKRISEILEGIRLIQNTYFSK